MEGEVLGINELKDFSEVISEEVKTDVLIRMGTKDDILTQNESKESNESKPDPIDSIGYSEEEFKKEFQEDIYDPAELFDEDSRITVQGGCRIFYFTKFSLFIIFMRANGLKGQIIRA